MSVAPVDSIHLVAHVDKNPCDFPALPLITVDFELWGVVAQSKWILQVAEEDAASGRSYSWTKLDRILRRSENPK